MHASAISGPFRNFKWFAVEGRHDGLEVKARFCGAVVHCGKPAPPASSKEQVLASARSWEPEYLLTADYPTGCKLLDAFLSVLVDGCFRSRTGVPEDPTLSQAKDEYLQIIRGGIVATDATNLPAQNFYFHLNRFVSGRRFFATDNGYIALGTSHARPGDCVAAILGHNKPVVLRPTAAGHYQVVGDCNLHGFRDFEALLGPLPDGWYVQDADINSQWCMMFVNGITGKLPTWNDPRLPGAPPGYKIEHDSYSRRKFVSIEGGAVFNNDPRLLDVEFLKARAVDIKDIVLV
jgi:hypothetical protein